MKQQRRVSTPFAIMLVLTSLSAWMLFFMVRHLEGRFGTGSSICFCLAMFTGSCTGSLLITPRIR